MTPVETMRQNLGNSLMAAGSNPSKFSRVSGLTQPTVANFLKGKSVSKRTLSKIEQAMIKKGWMQAPEGYVIKPITSVKKMKKLSQKPVLKTYSDLTVKDALISFIAKSSLTKNEKIVFLDYLL